MFADIGLINLNYPKVGVNFDQSSRYYESEHPGHVTVTLNLQEQGLFLFRHWLF